MPFFGPAEDARAAVAELENLETQPGDELLLVDNTPDGRAAGATTARVRVLAAPREQTGYHARNVGAEHASGEWILFTDADCKLPRGLLDAYFRPAGVEGCGAVVGGVLGARDQRGLIPRYARSRRHLDQAAAFADRRGSYGVTANLLVRRPAWEEVGGFRERAQAGEDTGFCWRLQDAGWSLELNLAAEVEHVHRDTLRGLLRQARRDAAGVAWLNRAYDRPQRSLHTPRRLARAGAGMIVWLLALRLERSLFKGLDALWFLAEARGVLESNEPAGVDPPRPARRIVVAARYPEGDQGHNAGGGRVEAVARASFADLGALHRAEIRYAEDDPVLRCTGALAWLLLRRGPACLAELARRRGGAEPTLRTLAPLVLRVRASGAVELTTAGPQDARTATRVARLSGLPLSA